MSRRDLYHEHVVAGLTKDGWIITDDPLNLEYAGRRLQVDLGAELPIGAEKAGRKIAVEIKTFLSDSEVYDLEVAVGQYVIYREMLTVLEPTRELILAVPKYSFDGIFSEPFGQFVVKQQNLKLLVYDDQERMIVQWL